MSNEEFISIIDDIRNGNYTDEQMRRLKEHRCERKRQKNQLEKQGKEIRDKRKRTKLDAKFEYLNDILKKVRVEGPLCGTEGGQVIEFDLILQGYRHSFTPEEFIEIMRQDTIDVWSGHNDSSGTKLI